VRPVITIVAHFYGVVRALQAADQIDASAEVIDLRLLRPLDFNTVTESVAAILARPDPG
jgi:pyruvate/2-oxoglutarate/acetoin dehydrogenase E1 component